MARPLKPAEERQSYKLQIGFTEPERAEIQRAADSCGVTYSEYVRESAVERARRTNKALKTAGRKRPSK